MSIRPATPSDIPALLNLNRNSPSAAHWSPTQYHNLFAKSHPQLTSRFILVVELPLVVKLSGQPLAPDAIQPQPVNPEIIACLVANHVDTEWELENIVVAEKSRRQGMGSRLLQAFVEHVRQSNGSFIFLEVRESNHAARALYEGFSFEITGRRKAYYPDPLEDAILYRWIVRKIS